MYLKLLNEEQKELFLDLALIIAQADGVYAESEVNTIQEYCYEMNIPLDRTTPKFTLNQLVEVMANSTNETENTAKNSDTPKLQIIGVQNILYVNATSTE